MTKIDENIETAQNMLSQIVERCEALEKENKELKEEAKKRKMIADENGEHYDMMKDDYEKLEKENKELKKKLDILYHQV